MPEGEPDHLVVALAGDVMLGRLVNETIQTRGFAHPWGDILPAIKESEAFLVNLECAITSHLQHWTNGEEKAFYFRANPAVIRTLQIAGVDFVSLANNHACDFEMQGLRETVRVLDRAGIAHAGAGTTLAEAEQPAVLEVAGQRICVLAFADYPGAWAAAPTRPGVNYTKISTDPESFGRVQASLTAAREIADLVIFSIHWGPNMISRPSAEFQDFRTGGNRRWCRRVLGSQRACRTGNRDKERQTHPSLMITPSTNTSATTYQRSSGCICGRQ